jgi:hypothetical protein
MFTLCDFFLPFFVSLNFVSSRGETKERRKGRVVSGLSSIRAKRHEKARQPDAEIAVCLSTNDQRHQCCLLKSRKIDAGVKLFTR